MAHHRRPSTTPLEDPTAEPLEPTLVDATSVVQSEPTEPTEPTDPMDPVQREEPITGG